MFNRVMRAGIFFVFLLGLNVLIQAQQFPSDRFHLGSVTLNDGTEMKGRIKYDLESDVILITEQGKSNIVTLSANQFQFFSIDGGRDGARRGFYSVPVVNKSGYKRPRIFELISQGRISLIAREFVATRTRTSSPVSYRRSMYDPFYDPSNRIVSYSYLAYNLWLIDENAEITELGENKNEVVNAFPYHHAELRRFIKKEKLKVDKIEDLAKLVTYYNSLDNL